MKNAPVVVAVLLSFIAIVLTVILAPVIGVWLVPTFSSYEAVPESILPPVQAENPGEVGVVAAHRVTEIILPPDHDEKSQCELNLRKMFAAVEAYRKDHKDTPDWLSDLVPTYLSDTNALVCPVARRTGVGSYPGLEDPRITTSYTYDFCAREVPNTVWGGAPVTMKDWKNRQRRVYGDDVPLIRCTHHDRVLNISYGGELFESSVTWESDDRFLQLGEGQQERPMQ